MDDFDIREDEDILVDLGAVSEETKGADGAAIEQANPLFRYN